MPCASFKIMADSLKQNSLLRYLRTSDNEKEVQRKWKELCNAFSEKETEELSASKKTRAEAELSKPKQNARCEHFKRNGRKVVNGLTILNYH